MSKNNSLQGAVLLEVLHHVQEAIVLGILHRGAGAAESDRQ
jgi:hypothetical protein